MISVNFTPVQGSDMKPVDNKSQSRQTAAHGKGDLVEFKPTMSFTARDLPGDSDQYVNNRLPTLSGLRPAPSSVGYYRLRDRQRKERLEHSSDEIEQQFSRFSQESSRLFRSFQPILNRYDNEVVLPTTCALGYTKPHHFDLDEKGVLGVERSFLFPDNLVNQIADRYVRLSASLLSQSSGHGGLHISMPRGKNCGWPTPRAQRTRSQSNVLMFLHCCLVRAGIIAGYSLNDLFSQLEKYHPPRICVNGERYQHAGKVLPVISKGGQTQFSVNFEPRVRGIYFSPKFAVMWNRFNVKRALRMVLSNPIHTQDRGEIRSAIGNALNKGYDLISLDVSKFDHSFGRDAGRQILRAWANILGRATFGLSTLPANPRFTDAKCIYDDLNAEFSVPFLVPNHDGLFISNGAEILSSGLSSTTIVGCLASELIGSYILSEGYGISLDDIDRRQRCLLLTYGDDMVIGVDKSLKNKLKLPTLLDVCQKVGETLQLKFSAEPTIKFLGQNYSMLEYNGCDSALEYPVARFLQQQFFPERLKDWPFSAVGFCARLSLVAKPMRADVYKLCRPYIDPRVSALQLDFSDPMRATDALLPEIQKYSDKISQMDDILQALTHGLSPDDAIDSGLALDESILDLLGQTELGLSLDLSGKSANPVSFDKPDDQSSIEPYRRELCQLARGNWNAYIPLLGKLAIDFRCPFTGAGDLFY